MANQKLTAYNNEKYFLAKSQMIVAGNMLKLDENNPDDLTLMKMYNGFL